MSLFKCERVPAAQVAHFEREARKPFRVARPLAQLCRDRDPGQALAVLGAADVARDEEPTYRRELAVTLHAAGRTGEAIASSSRARCSTHGASANWSSLIEATMRRRQPSSVRWSP